MRQIKRTWIVAVLFSHVFEVGSIQPKTQRTSQNSALSALQVDEAGEAGGAKGSAGSNLPGAGAEAGEADSDSGSDKCQSGVNAASELNTIHGANRTTPSRTASELDNAQLGPKLAPNAYLGITAESRNEVTRLLNDGVSMRHWLVKGGIDSKIFAETWEAVLFWSMKISMATGTDVRVVVRQANHQTMRDKQKGFFKGFRTLRDSKWAMKKFAKRTTTQIPRHMDLGHLMRLRILRALAPLICSVHSKHFNSEAGVCVTPKKGQAQGDADGIGDAAFMAQADSRFVNDLRRISPNEPLGLPEQPISLFAQIGPPPPYGPLFY